jgi:hypothetical protein
MMMNHLRAIALMTLMSVYLCVAFAAQVTGIAMPAVGKGRLDVQSLVRLPAKPPLQRIELKKHVPSIKVLIVQPDVAETTDRPDARDTSLQLVLTHRLFSYYPHLTTTSAERGPPLLS